MSDLAVGTNIVYFGEHRLGPVDGFYEVANIEHPNDPPQLWVPETLQAYEARCLAMMLEQAGEEYDVLWCPARGGFLPGGIVAYANEFETVLGPQVKKYGFTNLSAGKIEFVGVPDLGVLPKGMKHLVVDELADDGGTLDGVKVLLKDSPLNPKLVHTATPYAKRKKGAIEPDFSARTVIDRWLDFENHASRRRRNERLAELKPHSAKMMSSLGWLAQQPAHLELVPMMVAVS